MKLKDLLFFMILVLPSQVVYGQFGDGTRNPSSSFKKLLGSVVAASAGSCFSAALKSDGTLWVTGSNRYGQLGTGNKSDLDIFRKIADNVIAVEASWENLYFLKSDNTLWGCGKNKHGQLGTGNTEDQLLPVKIFENVKSFAPGAGHLLILTEKNDLWVVGENDGGQLSDGTLSDSSRPKFCMSDVLKVAAGQYHSVIIKNDGCVLFCGSNLDKIVSNDPSQYILNFTKIFENAIDIFSNYCSNSVYIKTIDNQLFSCGREVNKIFNIQTKPKIFASLMEKVNSISIGEQQIFVMKLDGTLYGWAGKTNNYGLLGNGIKESKFTKIFFAQKFIKIYTGIYHSLAITDTGDLLGTGYNGYGGLE